MTTHGGLVRFTRLVFLFAALAASASTGCKRGKGGGGGWFVGEEGLMANVDDTGKRGDGYELGETERLNAIACRYLDEAWVVGDRGTLLYTADAGGSWDAYDLGTQANLRDLATQDAGPVFVVGDGVFFTAVPEYTTGAARWTQLADGSTRFAAVAAAQRGETVLAIADDGTLWSYEHAALVRRATLPGARSIALSPDGLVAVAAGDGLSRSVDGGITWTPLAFEGRLNDVRVDERGEAVAVGEAGLVVRVDADGRVLRQTVGTATLRTLHIATGDYGGTGYAAGDGGQTWKTVDGGWSWSPGPDLGRTVLGVDEIGDGHN